MKTSEDSGQTFLAPIFRDISELINKGATEDQYKQIEEKYATNLASVINVAVEVGEGPQTETGRPQIDVRKFNKFLKDGEVLISSGNKDAIAKRFLRAVYEFQKRGNSLNPSQEVALGEDEDGKSRLENIPESKSSSDFDEGVGSTSVDEITQTFFGEDPIAAAEKIFFKGISYDQVRIIYDFAEKVVKLEQSFADLVKATGIDLNLLNSLPRVGHLRVE